MSKVYKRPDCSKYYYTSYFRGRRIRKCTGFTQKKYALELQLKWDLQITTGDLSFMGKGYYPTSDIRDFSRDYLQLRQRKSDKIYRTSKGMINRFICFLTENGIESMDEITIKALDEFIEALKLSPKTIKNYVGEIRLFLQQAVKEGIIKSNPSEYVTLPPIIKKNKHRNLEPVDLNIIFENAGPWFTYYSFLYHTGLRAGDVALLKHGDINYKRSAIVSMIRKSCRIHEIPLAKVLINQISPESNDNPIFPALYADTEVRMNDKIKKPRKYMQALLEAEGRPKATLHSFRTTFNNSLRDLGLKMEDRQALLAHSSSETTKIYTHPNFDLALDYVNQIKHYGTELKTVTIQ